MNIAELCRQVADLARDSADRALARRAAELAGRVGAALGVTAVEPASAVIVEVAQGVRRPPAPMPAVEVAPSGKLRLQAKPEALAEAQARILRGGPTSFVDLAGQKFGHLTVERRAPNDNKGRTYWHVRCDCGRATVYQGSQLKSGSAVSCGCERGNRPAIDETGKRYGRLVVIERTDSTQGNWGARWRCRCDCGKESVARGGDLRKGATTSCGCAKAESARAAKNIHRERREAERALETAKAVASANPVSLTRDPGPLDAIGWAAIVELTGRTATWCRAAQELAIPLPLRHETDGGVWLALDEYERWRAAMVESGRAALRSRAAS